MLCCITVLPIGKVVSLSVIVLERPTLIFLEIKSNEFGVNIGTWLLPGVKSGL